MLDRVTEAMQRPDARIAAVGEHQPARRAHTDHLVIQDVRRHPDQLELPAALTQHLMPRSKRNQMRETLQRNAVTVMHRLFDCFVKRYELRHPSLTFQSGSPT